MTFKAGKSLVGSLRSSRHMVAGLGCGPSKLYEVHATVLTWERESHVSEHTVSSS